MSMNDRAFSAAEGEATPGAAPAGGALIGLRGFGAATVLLGVVVGASAYGMMFVKTSIKEIGYARHILPVTPVTLFAAVLAGGLIWLGIGALMARRWARALLLVFACIWLGAGTIAMGFVGYMVPKTLPVFTVTGRPGNPSVPPAARQKVTLILFSASATGLMGLPLAWVLFFRRPQVKALCAARDPVVRWTDARPLPVLGAGVWVLLTTLVILIVSLVSRGLVPCFGTFLTGAKGMAVALALVAALGYGAWSLLRLEQRGWWLVLVVLAVFSVSAVMTFSRHDISKVYQLAGYPQPQIDRIRMSGALEAVRLAWLSAAFTWPFLGYLVYVKKFLRRAT